MTPEEQDRIEKAVHDAIQTIFDIDSKNIDEIRQTKRDLRFIRDTRQRCETLTGRVFLWGVIVVLGILTGIFGDGIKATIKRIGGA